MENLPGLQPDVPFPYQAPLGIDSYLAGNEAHAALSRQDCVGKDAEWPAESGGIMDGLAHACFLL